MAPIRTNVVYDFSKAGSYENRKKNVFKALGAVLGIPKETQLNIMEGALKYILETKERDDEREQQQQIAEAEARIQDLEKKMAEANAKITQLRETSSSVDDVGRDSAMAPPSLSHTHYLPQQMINPAMFPPQMYPFHNGFNPMMASGAPFGQMQSIHPFAQQMMTQPHPTFSGATHQNPHQPYLYMQLMPQQINENPLRIADADQLEEQDPQMDACQELAMAEDQAVEPVFGLTNVMVKRQIQEEQSQTETLVLTLANVKVDRDAPQAEQPQALPLMVKAEANRQSHTEPQDQQQVVNLAKTKKERDAHSEPETKFNPLRVKREI